MLFLPLFDPLQLLHKQLLVRPVGWKQLQLVPDKPYLRSDQGDAPVLKRPLLDFDPKRFLA